MDKKSSLLADIRLVLRHAELRPVYEVETQRRRAPNGPNMIEDFATVDGADNLAQAIVMRLLTPRGELAAVGHPEYGSRLHELIGRPNTETKRNLAKLYILETLQMEPRIEQVDEVTVGPYAGQPNFVNVQLRVKPKRETGTVSIGPFTLEL
jgi:phage baseplate assembly protein W